MAWPPGQVEGKEHTLWTQVKSGQTLLRLDLLFETERLTIHMMTTKDGPREEEPRPGIYVPRGPLLFSIYPIPWCWTDRAHSDAWQM